MNPYGAPFVAGGKIDVNLASHLRHTVNKAALYGIDKILLVGAGRILRIDMEMHPHTVSAPLLYRGRDAHPRNLFIVLGDA